MREFIYFTNIIEKGINNTSRWSCFQILQKASHTLKEVLLLGLPEILRTGSTSGPGSWCQVSPARPGSHNKIWQVFLNHTHYITVITSIQNSAIFLNSKYSSLLQLLYSSLHETEQTNTVQEDSYLGSQLPTEYHKTYTGVAESVLLYTKGLKFLQTRVNMNTHTKVNRILQLSPVSIHLGRAMAPSSYSKSLIQNTPAQTNFIFTQTSHLIDNYHTSAA